MAKRTYHLTLTLDNGEPGDYDESGDQPAFPTDAQLRSVCANSTAAEAFGEATGCTASLSVATPLTLYALVEGGVLQETALSDYHGNPVEYQLDLEDRDDQEDVDDGDDGDEEDWFAENGYEGPSGDRGMP